MKSAEIYLQELRQRVRKYYAYGENEGVGKRDLKSEIKGFLDAGIASGFIDVEETRQVIDEEHKNAFGMTLDERRARRKLGQLEEPVDWSQYDSPTYERLKTK